MDALLERGPFTAREEEKPALKCIKTVLENVITSGEAPPPRLVSADGSEVELPPTAYQLLRLLAYYLERDLAVSVVPIRKELTSQEAADILNVSRPYLVKLLDEGIIPSIKVGTHRRVRFNDLMEYRRHRDSERHKALTELTQLSQEMGLFDT